MPRKVLDHYQQLEFILNNVALFAFRVAIILLQLARGSGEASTSCGASRGSEVARCDTPLKGRIHALSGLA